MSFHSSAAEFTLVGGVVVDGSGRSPRRSDVRVVDGRIAEIGQSLSVGTGRRIDISGRILAPGFIDMHAHSEGPLWRGDGHSAKLLQGVTFELLGQDGLGFAPITGDLGSMLERIVPWHGTIDHHPGDHLRIVTFGMSLEARGVPVDFGLLVPHGSVRHSVIGDRIGPPTEFELHAMQRLVSVGIDDGAFGMSTGLAYTPARFAETAELVSLCRMVAGRGIFAPHLRQYSHGAIDSYAEGIAIAQRSGAQLHLTHAVMNGTENRSAVDHLIDMVRESGLDVSFDVYPYDAGSTFLRVLVPEWMHATPVEGWPTALATPATRDRLRDDLAPVDWRQIAIAGVADPSLRRMIGRRIADVAAEEATHPVDVFCDILQTDGLQTTCVNHNGNLDNIETLLLTEPRCAVASDSILVGDAPHPRGYGTFARLFEQYVATGRMKVEDAVHRITGLPRSILGLTDIGTIEAGARANLVCFDPASVRENATYESPMAPSSGFDDVWVGGQPVACDGEVTERLPGRFVRAGR